MSAREYLLSEIETLLRDNEELRQDAERWRYARTIFAIDDIETAYALCGHPSHIPDESESVRADHAIDIARGAA